MESPCLHGYGCPLKAVCIVIGIIDSAMEVVRDVGLLPHMKNYLDQSFYAVAFTGRKDPSVLIEIFFRILFGFESSYNIMLFCVNWMMCWLLITGVVQSHRRKCRWWAACAIYLLLGSLIFIVFGSECDFTHITIFIYKLGSILGVCRFIRHIESGGHLIQGGNDENDTLHGNISATFVQQLDPDTNGATTDLHRPAFRSPEPPRNDGSDSDTLEPESDNESQSDDEQVDADTEETVDSSDSNGESDNEDESSEDEEEGEESSDSDNENDDSEEESVNLCVACQRNRSASAPPEEVRAIENGDEDQDPVAAVYAQMVNGGVMHYANVLEHELADILQNEVAGNVIVAFENDDFVYEFFEGSDEDEFNNHNNVDQPNQDLGYFE